MAFDLPRPAFLPALLGACLLALAAPVVVAPPARAGLVGSPEVVVDGLQVPWDVVLLPDGKTLVTERPGRVRVIEADGTTLRTQPAYADASVDKFLGMTLHPGFAANRFVYLYVTYAQAQNPNASRVLRFTVDQNGNFTDQQTVFQGGIRSDGNHDGGRIAFGPDGKLYVTTGDVHDPSLPQNIDSLNGKILRLEAPGGAGDGVAPADNPFNSVGETRQRRFVWSYGHRHPQGIDWDVCGRMWETEHGPTGESYTGSIPNRGSRDEINVIERGANYGWPVIVGNETREGMRSPTVSSGDSTTWAPGGLAFGPDGRLYAPLLAGQRLLDFGTAGATVTDRREVFGGSGGFGRLRDATVGRGALWITTSNATSSATEKVLRVPFDSAGPSAAAADCSAAHPSGSNPPATNPVPTSERARLGAVLRRWNRRLRAVGLARLLRRGSVTLDLTGLTGGSLALRLERTRRGAAPLLLAAGRGTALPAARRRTVVLLRLTRAGRRVLRGHRGPIRLVLRATFRPASGGRTQRLRALTIPR